jgi:CDI immunity protein
VAAIYKVKKKGYLLHADRKTTTGLRLAWQPFIQIHESDFAVDTIANAIKEVIKESENEERVANPKNWSENSKQFFKNMGLKSPKELYAATTKHCGIGKENGNIIFTPTKHAELPDQGFVNKSKDEPNIIVSLTASNQEITEALELAFSKCE